ncbi:phospholysine phosphohistidine inorganic pyrophosphate phosphatase-like isoform X3 [Lycorma delicatula]|uniref:phospholysine phosphohistidine inorganic pyrophosphate phosphatase-like isoform X3 n=2 Tax=Lycorma delicatula TaxID=130591 RepID=UPI003F517A45
MYSLLSVRLGKMKDLFCSPVKGVLIDISGVLKDGNKAIPGSIEAFKRLVTNETQTTVKGLVKKLHNLGFNVNEKDIFAPIPAVIKIVKNENLHPFLLLHPDALEDFSDIDKNHPNCVILGDADYCFTYDAMNNAFRALMQMEKPILISLGKGKYYRAETGLTLDVGPFTAALEYSTGVQARIVGKPESSFFLAAVNDIGIKPDEALMIGDDIASDVGGAQKSGIRGVLVRTGKFQPEDENHEVKPDCIVNDFNEIIKLLFENQLSSINA